MFILAVGVGALCVHSVIAVPEEHRLIPSGFAHAFGFIMLRPAMACDARSDGVLC